VIREIVMGLWYSYGVRCISGVKWGFKGFYTDSEESWIELTPSIVKDIHHLGGTLLGSSRGGFSEEDNTDRDKILAALKARGINHMYCIGGDGTHRAIKKLADKIKEDKLRISIVGVPKTIDNDLAVMDKTFGFETAVEVAQLAIESANIEANSAQNGVGLVKLMGRYAGHIALHASLASRDVIINISPLI
jgi:6-phosphofructokinase 1